MISLFSAPWSPQRPADDDGRPMPPPAGAMPPQAQPAAKPWLYFNLVASETQVFVPVYDVGVAQDAAATLWAAPSVAQVRRDRAGHAFSCKQGAARHPVVPTLPAPRCARTPQSEYERVADLVLGTMILEALQQEGEYGALLQGAASGWHPLLAQVRCSTLPTPRPPSSPPRPSAAAQAGAGVAAAAGGATSAAHQAS